VAGDFEVGGRGEVSFTFHERSDARGASQLRVPHHRRSRLLEREGKLRKRFAGYWLNKLLSAFELEFRQLTKTPL
jgi:hypothetical protein